MPELDGLIPASFTPIMPVHEPYKPAADVIEWRSNADGTVVQEIVSLESGALGLRYKAWINVASPTSTARHRWWSVKAKTSLETRDPEYARKAASVDAYANALALGSWNRANAP